MLSDITNKCKKLAKNDSQGPRTPIITTENAGLIRRRPT